MAYTTINKSKDHFDGKIYLGSSSAVTVTGLEFQPDLVWVKDRDNGNNHCWVDAVRGVGKYIQSDNTSAEVNNSSQSISAFTSDGFTTGTANPANESASTTKGFMSWNWKANGAGSANTDGSINSTVSVNTTAGFSVVKYTATGSNATVGHGLGAVPKMIIVKDIADSGGSDWVVYHQAMGNGSYIRLNLTSDKSNGSTYWQDTTPTNSVFSIGTSSLVNNVGNATIAYCFAEKTGYSKFGSYTGNGNNDGTFVYTGFAPAFVITKNTSITDWWGLFDNKRLGYNSSDSPRILFPNTSDAESSSKVLDFTSNGFKIKTSNGAVNGSGNTIIYMAFGQSLVGSNNIPCTAR